MSDFLILDRDLYVGVRFYDERYRGTKVGTEDISSDDVLSFFAVAPLALDKKTVELALRLGLFGWVTAEVSMPIFQAKMLNTTSTSLFETTSETYGDVAIRGLFDLLEMDQYRLSLTLGGTIPTGKLRKWDVGASGVREILPYALQGGSGTPDILAGLTFLVQNEVASTGAQINLLKAQVNSARREYNRIKMLAAEGLATPQQLDQAASQLEQANLGLKQARVGQSMSVVRSPFTGKVARKYLDKGEFAAPGQPVVDLIDDSIIKMEVTVPESAIAFVKIGDEVEVNFTAVDRSFTGKVVRRGVMVTQPTQTFPIEINIPNEDRQIIPGMRASVIVPKLTLKDAVVVSRDALLEGVTRREAMVMKEANGDVGKASLRIVEIGEARGNDVVITKGISPGDQLIVLGHRNVVDGTPVRVVKRRPSKTANDATPAPKAPENAGEPEGQEEVEK